MELITQRDLYSNTETLGEFFIADERKGDLFINKSFFGYSLEDRVRDINKDGDLNDVGEQKIHSITAIPAGRYEVRLTHSPRFKRVLPEILNVPGFAGIRIHGGNAHINTEGCILIARNRTIGKLLKIKDRTGVMHSVMNWIQGSLENELVQLLNSKKGKHYITIIDKK